jgi:hypothetical protein
MMMIRTMIDDDMVLIIILLTMIQYIGFEMDLEEDGMGDDVLVRSGILPLRC